jgi:peptidyl-prolyl isomerase D
VATDSGDSFEDYPDDEDRDLSKPETVIEIAKVIREIGNHLYKEGKIEEAHQKYQSNVFDRSSSSRHLYLVLLESIRYLDTHQEVPEKSPELKETYIALLTPLLLNSSLAAIRATPPSTSNALTAITNTTRALNKLYLSIGDKG